MTEYELKRVLVGIALGVSVGCVGLGVKDDANDLLIGGTIGTVISFYERSKLIKSKEFNKLISSEEINNQSFRYKYILTEYNKIVEYGDMDILEGWLDALSENDLELILESSNEKS